MEWYANGAPCTATAWESNQQESSFLIRNLAFDPWFYGCARSGPLTVTQDVITAVHSPFIRSYAPYLMGSRRPATGHTW